MFSLVTKLTEEKNKMTYQLFSDPRFHDLLIQIDIELANLERQKGCRHCGGKLHSSPYPRSPFGLPEKFREYYQSRFSLCCEDCRKRRTPPSVRFFGRRWFPAPLFILISSLSMVPSERRCAAIHKHFGVRVSKTTWERWRNWWHTHFPVSSFWKQFSGLFNSEMLPFPFPRNILNTYQGPLFDRLINILKFLSPITINIYHAV